MASNGDVIYMKEVCIIDMNIFEVWVIVVRFHLEGRNYAQSTKILYSEYNLADYALKTTLNGKMIYTGCLRLVETIDFDIKIIQIRVRMQKLEQSECSPVTRRDVACSSRRNNQDCFWACFHPRWFTPQKRPARCSQFKPNSFGKFG